MEVKQKPQLHHDWINPHALGIVRALQKGGFTTYLVGGCVRDLLIGIYPKDFDIATLAQPPQVKRLIHQAYIIGKRFRLVLVKRDDLQFEVATFRREVRAEEFPDGVPFGDNVFGTPQEDAQRRDFTINGLFYDPVEDKLIDYCQGLKDIELRQLRMIGDPDARLIEDSIRILRALRLSHKIGFSIEASLRAAMMRHAPELAKAVLPRRREEILKILRLKDPEMALLEAMDLDLLRHITPTLQGFLENAERAEIFFANFRRNHRMAPETADTVHLFGWLIFSMYQTVSEGDADSSALDRFLNDNRVQAFMRDELGMYKFEQATVSKALQTLTLLSRVEDFRKRGERRQFSVVKGDGFQLALQMAETDYLLPPDDLQFWKDLWTRFSPRLQEMADDEKSKRRSTNRRRRSRKNFEGAAVNDGENEEALSASSDVRSET